MIRVLRPMTFAAAVLLGAVAPARAEVTSAGARYALIIGNNHGASSDVVLDNLLHAEDEARRLHRRLVDYGRFDAERSVVLTGAGREAILNAARTLGALREADQRRRGEHASLFAFFFTGHGLAGQLLTRDAPITGNDLNEIFKTVGAELSLGFLDACFSGSFDPDLLAAKGVVSTPNFNPIKELPREVLASEGSMWLVSSRPDEVSYEDERLGSLFTHFFVESFTAAPSSGPGITLENMWEYARSKTNGYAARQGRSQTPEKIVLTLKDRAPLYFSFPGARRATLTFDEDLAGEFVVQYLNIGLSERISKVAGSPLSAKLFDGEIVLSRVNELAPERIESCRLSLARGDNVLVGSEDVGLMGANLGFVQRPVRSKGYLPGLVMTSRVPLHVAALGAGYKLARVPRHMLGAPQLAVVSATSLYGDWSWAVDGTLGRHQDHRPAWGYTLEELGVAIRGAYGLGRRSLRFDVEALVASDLALVRYSSGKSIQRWGARLGGGLRGSALWPAGDSDWIVSVRTGAAERYGHSVARNDKTLYRGLEPYFELSLAWRWPNGR